MGSESLLMVIVIGGVSGWLAGLLMRGSGYGILGDIIVGLIGAFIGNWLVHAMHLSVNVGNPIANRILMVIVALLRPRSLRERLGDVWRRR